MAEISHTSGGASNSPKGLTVTGRIIEPPNIANMWLNYQLDHKLIASGSNVATWEDAVNGNIMLASTPVPPTLDATNPLIGLPTPRTGGGVKYLRKYGTITGAPATNTETITFALIFRGGAYVNPSDWDGHGTARRILSFYKYVAGSYSSPLIEIAQRPSTMAVSIKVGGSSYMSIGAAGSNWTMLIVSLVKNDTDREIRYKLNGGALTAVTFATGAWAANMDILEIGAYSFGSTATFPGNYGALMSWKGVTFSTADYAKLEEYLRAKYGLA